MDLGFKQDVREEEQPAEVTGVRSHCPYPALSVRPALSSDGEALLQLGAQCFPEEVWTAAVLDEARSRQGGLFLVAEDRSGTVVGFLNGWIVVDELEIAQVGVLSERRRSGIGALLLVEALWDAARQGVRAAFLEVRASNAAARALYARHGFEQLGIRRGYYHEPREDALLLRAKVDPSEVEERRRIFSCRSKHRVA